MWDGCPKSVRDHGDRVVVTPPQFSGTDPRRSIAADPGDPRRIAIGSSVEAFVSFDAGCNWVAAFPSDTYIGWLTLAGFEGTSLVGLAVQQHAAVYAGSGYKGWATLRVRRWDNGAQSQSELPPALVADECSDAAPCLMRFGRGLGVGYASAPGMAGVAPRMAVTTDGGRTWKERDVPALGRTASPVTDMAVDPSDPHRVVVVAGGALFESRDAAATWRRVDAPALSGRADVLLTPGTGRELAVIDGVEAGTVLYERRRGARRLAAVTTVPGRTPGDVAMGPTDQGQALYVAADGLLYRESQPGKLAVVISERAGIEELRPTTTGLWALGPTLYYVPADGDAANAVPVERRRPFRPGAGRSAGRLTAVTAGGSLRPAAVVRVPPGGSGTAVVGASLARQPRGLDVFFLMDTTGSMAAKIKPIASALADVVDELNERGVEARFGLGEYGSSSFRYRRHADLDASPYEVQNKMTALQPTGGEEFHYDAFYQLATGKGHKGATPLSANVEPGQQANFDPGSLHVVVHATDDVDQSDTESVKGPDALAALNSVGVRHIGIYPYDGARRDARNDPQMHALRHYASVTGTLTPKGGMDCDGDGGLDLAEGAPIACWVEGATNQGAPIAELLSRVLLSLTNFQPVTLHVGPSPVDVSVTPLGDYGAVDLHHPHDALGFRLTVTCPAGQAGARVDVPLELHVGGVPIAAAPQPVECVAPRPPRVRQDTLDVIPPRPPAALVAGVPAIAPAPTAVAQSVATAEASASAASQVPAAQAQVGLAAAPDEVVEVVTAEAGEDETRFVARRTVPATVPLGGIALAVALALLHQFQPRGAPAPARTDRRTRR